MILLLGAIADDFTGATDLASMLTRAGMRTILKLDAPAANEPLPQAEAVVVALKSRTAPVAEAVADSLASWRWMAFKISKICVLLAYSPMRACFLLSLTGYTIKTSLPCLINKVLPCVPATTVLIRCWMHWV